MTSLCFAEIADWCCSVSYWTLLTKPIKFRRRCIYICPNGPWVQFDWKRGTTFQRVILRTLIFVIVPSLRSRHYGIIYFASAAVAVDPSNMTASSSASWSRFRPPSNFVNGHVSIMWFMVCRRPQLQEGDWVRPNLCKLARHRPWPVRKWLIRDRVWWGRSKPGHIRSPFFVSVMLNSRYQV